MYAASVTHVHPAKAVGWNEMPFGRDTRVVSSKFTRYKSKNKTSNSCPYSPNIDRFLKYFHRYTHQEICNKKIITDPTTPITGVAALPLRNISLQKSHRPKAQQRKDRACACEENVRATGELVY